MTPREPYLSIVLPCLNGERYVREALGELSRFLDAHRDEIPSSELLLVDDGSSDRTAQIVEADFPRVRLVRLEANRGKGAAVRAGILAATGRFRAFVDADMPYDLGVLPVMLRYVDFKEFHLAIGSRSAAPGAGSPGRGAARRLASWLYTLFVSRLVVTGVRDTQCGFKVFQGEVAGYLFSQSRIDNFAFDVEILYLAFKNDLDVKRVPVTQVRDEASTVSLLRHSLPMLASILRVPLRWYAGRYRLLHG